MSKSNHTLYHRPVRPFECHCAKGLHVLPSLAGGANLPCWVCSSEMVNLESYDSEGPLTPETDDSAEVSLPAMVW